MDPLLLSVGIASQAWTMSHARGVLQFAGGTLCVSRIHCSAEIMGFGWMVGSLEHYFDVSSSSKRRCLSISDFLVNLVIRWWGCQIGFFFLRDGECLMGSPASDRHPMNDVGRPQKKQHAHIVMNILYIISMSITI